MSKGQVVQSSWQEAEGRGEGGRGKEAGCRKQGAGDSKQEAGVNAGLSLTNFLHHFPLWKDFKF